ncbi:DUF2505 domain-containing protein [Nocardia paucivorans]|uniref:DUF2505 domain-containing protein n=1 Tax=Nocardia paucivorans TaxID=114259 RepID=UPI0002E0527A|nr:DUF2505 domain-containing protein [Nocardia paucivorans]
MARKFSFTLSYPVPPSRLHAALTSDELWQARFVDATETATLELSHPDGPGTIRLGMSEVARADRIPAVVRKVLKSELRIIRTDTWGPLTGDTAEGTFHGTSTGISSEMTGTYRLRPAGSGSEIETVGSVKVKVPLVGGAIEPLAEQLHHRVLSGERKFIEDWFAARQD